MQHLLTYRQDGADGQGSDEHRDTRRPRRVLQLAESASQTAPYAEFQRRGLGALTTGQQPDCPEAKSGRDELLRTAGT